MSKRKYHLRKERWYDVKGYEGLYQYSNLGNIRSLDRYVKGRGNTIQFKKGEILTPDVGRTGYLRVTLFKDGKRNRQLVHRIVALNHIPNPDPIKNTEVEHKDTHRDNNCIWNLEWVDHIKNSGNPKTREHISKALNGKPKYVPLNATSSKPVNQYTKDGKYITSYPSATEASRITGIGNSIITDCCRHRPHCLTAGGYKWEYAV